MNIKIKLKSIKNLMKLTMMRNNPLINDSEFDKIKKEFN